MKMFRVSLLTLIGFAQFAFADSTVVKSDAEKGKILVQATEAIPPKTKTISLTNTDGDCTAPVLKIGGNRLIADISQCTNKTSLGPTTLVTLDEVKAESDELSLESNPVPVKAPAPVAPPPPPPEADEDNPIRNLHIGRRDSSELLANDFSLFFLFSTLKFPSISAHSGTSFASGSTTYAQSPSVGIRYTYGRHPKNSFSGRFGIGLDFQSSTSSVSADLNGQNLSGTSDLKIGDIYFVTTGTYRWSALELDFGLSWGSLNVSSPPPALSSGLTYDLGFEIGFGGFIADRLLLKIISRAISIKASDYTDSNGITFNMGTGTLSSGIIALTYQF